MFSRTKPKTADWFTLPSGERRRAYRVHPAPDDPIALSVAGRTVPVRDISAGGLSFADAGWVAGDRERIVFRLPNRDTEVATDLEVVSVDADGLVHGRFLDLDSKTEDAIHLYVLERQKQEIRREGKGT